MTEIWMEYLRRHKLPIVKPYSGFIKIPDMFVREYPPYEHRVWMYFLYHHRQHIRNCSYKLDDESREWNYGRPPFGEQRKIIFGHVPYMELLWAGWQDRSFNFQRA